MRTVLNSENQGRTRSDLLFTMSNNTRTTKQAWAGAKSLHLWTSETGCERGVPFSSHALLNGHRGDKSFAPEPEQKRMPIRSFETAGNHARQTTRAKQQSQPEPPSVRIVTPRIMMCRIVTAGLVEPDGIEPTTSCLQSRRSPS